MNEISTIIRARLDKGRSISDEDVRQLLAERDALQKKGCARDQKTTQFCAEATALQARVAELEVAQARLILSFRLNILRLNPKLSHETISKAIDAALEGKRDE